MQHYSQRDIYSPLQGIQRIDTAEMSTDRPRAKGGAHTMENPAISYYMDKLGEDEN